MRFKILLFLSVQFCYTYLSIAQTQLSLVENIDHVLLQEKTNKGAQLVDVRTNKEFSRGYIAGAKLINISSDYFVERIDQLDKTKPIILYCAVGVRSTAAIEMIRNLGFPIIYNYIGGIRDWKRNKLSLVKPD